jgi:rhodanese-related sulfurtransferase
MPDDTELPPERLAEMLREGDVQLIDVRETFEHEAGRIAGDRHVAFDALVSQADTLERDKPVVFYCRSGNRSAVAVEAFRGGGFDAYNLAGGLVAWVESGQPLEPEDGEVASH